MSEQPAPPSAPLPQQPASPAPADQAAPNAQRTAAPDPSVQPERHLLLVRLLPNLVSILGLCAGLTAVRFAISGNVSTAVLLIVLAACLDGLDGRLARLLRSESAIGAELDSLCDFVNFGVVPALVLYFWGLRGDASMGWIAVLIYAVCCMLRLARFNVGSRADVPQEKSSFVGVPSPAGAMLALTPIYLSNVTGSFLPAGLTTFWMILVGGLMISRLPTPSLKRVRIPASAAPFVLVAGVAGVALVITYPWATLLLFSGGYSALLIWHFLQWFRRNNPLAG